MTLKLQEPRMIVVEDVTGRWSRLDKPVTNEYTGDIGQWELNISSTNPAKKQEMVDVGLICKPDKNEPDRLCASLSRKSMRSDGQGGLIKNQPVVVVHADAKTPFKEEIGNGSIVDVSIWQAPYEPKTPTQNGIKSILTAVMVTDHVKASSTATTGFTAKGSAPVKPTDGFSDKTVSEMNKVAEAVNSQITVDKTKSSTEIPF